MRLTTATNHTFENVSPDMRAALSVMSTVLLFYSALWLLFVVSDIIALLYHWRNRQLRTTAMERRVLTMRRLLFAGAVNNMFTFALIGSTAFLVPFKYGQDKCNAIVKSFSIGYTVSLQCVFLFFIVRSSVVQGLHHTRRFRLVSNLTKLGLLVFVPAFTFPYVIVALEGTITADGVCVVGITLLWFMITFIVGIVVLTAATTYLFAIPLCMSLETCNPQVAANVKRVLYRNLVLNMIGMAGTIVCMTLFLYYNQRTGLSVDSVRGIIFSSSDITILGICSRLMLVDEAKQVRNWTWLHAKGERYCRGCCYSPRKSPVATVDGDVLSSMNIPPPDEATTVRPSVSISPSAIGIA